MTQQFEVQNPVASEHKVLSKKHHWTPVFFLSQFVDPSQPDCFWAHYKGSKKWNRAKPRSIGYENDANSIIDDSGRKTDAFEQRLAREVDEPSARVLKKAINDRHQLTSEDYENLLRFILFLAGRNPGLQKSVISEYVQRRQDDHELETEVNEWCDSIESDRGQVNSQDFFKPSLLGAIPTFVHNQFKYLSGAKWHFISTTPDKPFVVSDKPVNAELGDDVRLITCPLSSLLAVIIIAGGDYNDSYSHDEEVSMLNMRTIEKAERWIACCQQSFPGDNFLDKWM
ncbi:MAG: DUF4238 domain-containing protein [Planctomycetes bacterium]|nr:DUF4238 domain-containing protein [Planctomycetota bacterium]